MTVLCDLNFMVKHLAWFIPCGPFFSSSTSGWHPTSLDFVAVFLINNCYIQFQVQWKRFVWESVWFEPILHWIQIQCFFHWENDIQNRTLHRSKPFVGYHYHYQFQHYSVIHSHPIPFISQAHRKVNHPLIGWFIRVGMAHREKKTIK